MGERKIGLQPVVFSDSRLLILGSFPSVKSRETQFYYGHKQNRFWKVVCGYFHEEIPTEKGEKIAFLKRRKIALWDMVMECEIDGSADSTVRQMRVADLDQVFQIAKIERILLNGKLAYDLFCERYTNVEIPYEKMPSTSPANPRFDEKIWRRALNDVFGIS